MTSRVSRVPIIVAVVILVVLAAPVLFTRHLANQQDQRALTQRADAVHVNVSASVATQRTALRSLANSLQAEGTSPEIFNTNGAALLRNSQFSYAALIDTTQTPPTIVESVGVPNNSDLTALPQFQQAVRSLSVAQPFATSGVLPAGNKRFIGLISGPPVAPANRALYGEIAYNPSDPATAAALLGARHDIDAALYSGPVSDANLVISTTSKLPLRGKVVSENTLVGTSEWQVVVRERHPVADALTRAVPWIILGGGILIALLSAFAVNVLVRRRDDALLLARERSQENLSILEAAREAFLSIREDGIISRWSSQATELFGYSNNEVIGKHITDVIVPAAEREERRNRLALMIEGGGDEFELNQRIEIEVQQKNGTIFPIEMSLWTAYANGHKMFNAIAHDITERRRAAENLATVTQRALEASRLKSEFLANMSHEIRTPMNGVLGMTSLLLDSKLTKDQREQAHVVQKSAESLLKVINDILDFSKIEAGKLEIEKSNFDVRELVEEVSMLFSTIAKQKHINLIQSVTDDTPAEVYGDASRLRQVLLNVVGNAIKFTSKGSVTIKCESESVPTGDRLYFEITDTGIGIAPESRERLFESFVQVDMSSTRTHEGTGLGLAISSRLVALMNGEIGVRSEPGKGSTFWFSVLVGHATEQVVKKITNDVSITGLVAGDKQPNVLVVEDNPVNQRVAELTLERLGCSVTLVDGGESAVTAINQNSFDIVFMDCQMPGMDGYEATRRIRRAEDGVHHIIVAMTASAMQGDRERALESGMDDYLSKPVKIEDFVRVLSKWLSPEGGKLVKQQSEIQAARPEKKVDLSALEELRDRTATNPDVYTGIINTYLKQADELMETIRSATTENDRETLARAAHKLRGSSATVGAIEMAQLCTDIEVILADSRGQLLPQTVDKLEASLVETRRLFNDEISGRK